MVKSFQVGSRHRDQLEVQRVDFVQHPEQGRLIDEFSPQQGHTVGVRTDFQPFEPVRPAVPQIAIHPDLVFVKLFHFRHRSKRDGRFSAQAWIAAQFL